MHATKTNTHHVADVRLVDGVLGGQGHRTNQNDGHDEAVEGGLGHELVDLDARGALVVQDEAAAVGHDGPRAHHHVGVVGRRRRRLRRHRLRDLDLLLLHRTCRLRLLLLLVLVLAAVLLLVDLVLCAIYL